MATPTWRKAASVLIVATSESGGYEICLVKRSASSRLFPNHYVFPGGTIEPSDQDLARAFSMKPEDTDSLTLKVGAIREVFEETGLVFAGAPRSYSARERERGIQPPRESFRASLARLSKFSVWVTPEDLASTPRRGFETHFYVSFLEGHQKVDVEPDGTEISEVLWVSPGSAHFESIVPKLAMPQLYMLSELGRCSRHADLPDHIEMLRKGLFRYPYKPVRVPLSSNDFAFVLPGDASHNQYRSLSGEAWEHRGVYQPNDNGEYAYSFIRSDALIRAADRAGTIDTDWCKIHSDTLSRL